MHSPLRFCFESWVGLNVAKCISFFQKNAFASSPISAATVSNAFARALKKHFRGWWPHEKMFKGSKSKMHWSKCQHASASTLVTSASTWVTEMLSSWGIQKLSFFSSPKGCVSKFLRNPGSIPPFQPPPTSTTRLRKSKVACNWCDSPVRSLEIQQKKHGSLAFDFVFWVKEGHDGL